MSSLLEKLLTVVRTAVAYVANHKRTRIIAIVFLCLAFLGMSAYSVLLAAPPQFPTPTLLNVKKGTTLSVIASKLKEKHLVNYATLFELVARGMVKEGTIVAGEYSFTRPESVISMARRLTSGDFQVAPVKIRIEEGASALQITNLLRNQLPDFDAEAFYALASPLEGTLFPDTYFFLPGQDPELIIDAMTDNFDEHMRDATLAARIATFGKPVHDVLVMASLLEKEAAVMQDRRIIAGILWRRIDNNMLLQVDAVFPYIIGKNTFNLTRADLQTDSPYNTYKYKGLPPGPIGNPSIDAISAAVTPLTTSYVYYLSDREGNMHYATTYAQHLANKAKYLSN
jgi:UPF0755 protein